jgi:hypothetical protein
MHLETCGFGQTNVKSNSEVRPAGKKGSSVIGYLGFQKQLAGVCLLTVLAGGLAAAAESTVTPLVKTGA